MNISNPVRINNQNQNQNEEQQQQQQPQTTDDTTPILPIMPVREKGTSGLETLMHIIKANIGTGVLAMPLAFKNGGLVLSSISIWILGVICVHCMHILLNCYNYVLLNRMKDSDAPAQNDIGYDDVIEYSLKYKFMSRPKLAKASRALVSVFLIISQLGFCCVYYVFIPTNIKQVVDYYHPDNPLTIRTYMYLLLVPMILFCMIKNLKILAPFSAFANFLMITGMLVILYAVLSGEPAPFDSLDLIGPIKNISIFYSSAIYAFEGISLVLPVYNEMRHKSQFAPWNGVLNTGMSLVAIMYFTIGFYGYLKYGKNAAASITLNLSLDQWPFRMLKIMFSIAIFISYNLQFYVAANILWSFACRNVGYLKRLSTGLNGNRLIVNERLIFIFEHLFRSFLILFTFALAIMIPRIDLFISLVGAIAGSVLALVIPPIFDLLLFYETSKNKKFSLVKNILIFLFGLYIFFAGTFFSVSDIVDYFNE